MWYASGRQAVTYALASPAFCEYGCTMRRKVVNLYIFPNYYSG